MEIDEIHYYFTKFILKINIIAFEKRIEMHREILGSLGYNESRACKSRKWHLWIRNLPLISSQNWYSLQWRCGDISFLRCEITWESASYALCIAAADVTWESLDVDRVISRKLYEIVLFGIWQKIIWNNIVSRKIGK